MPSNYNDLIYRLAQKLVHLEKKRQSGELPSPLKRLSRTLEYRKFKKETLGNKNIKGLEFKIREQLRVIEKGHLNRTYDFRYPKEFREVSERYLDATQELLLRYNAKAYVKKAEEKNRVISGFRRYDESIR